MVELFMEACVNGSPKFMHAGFLWNCRVKFGPRTSLPRVVSPDGTEKSHQCQAVTQAVWGTGMQHQEIGSLFASGATETLKFGVLRSMIAWTGRGC